MQVDARRGLARDRLRSRRLLRLLVIAAVGLVPAAWAESALAAPVWRLDSLSNTAVAPDGTLQYLVQLANDGDVDSDATEIRLLARLDPDLTAVEAVLVHPAGGRGGTPIGNCTADDGSSPVDGARAVLCTTTEIVPAVINSGGTNYIRLTLTARASSSAGGSLLTSFEVSGGGGEPASTVDPTLVSTEPTPFGIDAFDGSISADAAGTPSTQAGARPYEQSVTIAFNTITNPVPLAGAGWPVEPVKDVFVDLPPGLVGNPTIVDTCTAEQLANGTSTAAQPLCPATSQIGTALVHLNGFPTFASPFGPVPIFNMVPPPNAPARFGFNVLGSVVVLDAELRSGGDYGLTVAARNISEALAISGTTTTFWGVPASPSHDFERACPGQVSPSVAGPTCVSGAPLKAFLRNPTSCPDPGVGLTTTARVDSWFNPGVFDTATWVSHDLPGYPYPVQAPPSAPGEQMGPPQGTTGCARVPFTPTFKATPTATKAGKPAGFAFDLSIPQTDDPDLVSQADLKRAVVTLPEGVRVSPSSANGLGACSPAEIGIDNGAVPSCPESSKIGTIEIDTPLLDKPLAGSVYLARQRDNPFGSLLSIYLVARGPGLVVKLPGKVEAHPISGQLTATFDDNPQLPFANLHIEFKGGDRAPLVLPKRCGTYTTNAVLTGWNGTVAASTSSFSVSRDGNGAACPPVRFSPGFSAGTKNAIAGRSSPLHLRFTRSDDDEELKAVTVDMPNGLTGKIANVPLCGDADAKAGTCPEGSRVGQVTVGAGAGNLPFYIQSGRAYFTGPYKGAPFGLSIVVPAVAGPFDLGNVSVRSAVFVDKHTSELRVISDSFPRILEGIPLDVRDIRVSVDRDDFIVNPTNCKSMSIGASIESTEGKTARVSSRFQVADCARLGFKPRMALSVGSRGHTSRGASVPFSTTLRMPRANANLRYVRVTLPRSINARLPIINRACTRAQYEAGNCRGARAGTAVAKTPLLRNPLVGNVYFVKNGRPLPDLFIALRGQVDFDLIGRVSIPGSTRLSTTFDAIPDVPVTSFTLKLVSGGQGPVGAAMNLCSVRGSNAKAELDFIGQNGKVKQTSQRMKVRGCESKPKRGKGGRGR